MNIELTILLMAVVTVIPRVLPCSIASRVRLSSRLQAFLGAIPYAALGALIFPGILNVSENGFHEGLVAGLCAVLVAALTKHILLTMLVAIGVMLVFQLC